MLRGKLLRPSKASAKPWRSILQTISSLNAGFLSVIMICSSLCLRNEVFNRYVLFFVKSSYQELGFQFFRQIIVSSIRSSISISKFSSNHLKPHIFGKYPLYVQNLQISYTSLAKIISKFHHGFKIPRRSQLFATFWLWREDLPNLE